MSVQVRMEDGSEMIFDSREFIRFHNKDREIVFVGTCNDLTALLYALAVVRKREKDIDRAMQRQSL